MTTDERDRDYDVIWDGTTGVREHRVELVRQKESREVEHQRWLVAHSESRERVRNARAWLALRGLLEEV